MKKIKEVKMKKDKKEQYQKNETVENVENMVDIDEENKTNEIEELKAENNKLKDDYLRACAELENTKKRCAVEIEKTSKYALSSFAKEILSVADNLHRALDAAENLTDLECEQLKKGVELTESELTKVLAKFGVVKMEPMGQIFNPAFHRVVQEIEDKSKPAGTIVAELQTGYMLNDRILREAMVVVSK